MANSSNSTTWPKGRSHEHTGVEELAHIAYRNAILLVNPHMSLPDNVVERLHAIRVSKRKQAVTEELINVCRESLRAHGSHLDDFYRKHAEVIFKIKVLTSRLENMKDFQQDMRARLEDRLRSVRMTQKWNERDRSWVWVLELDEEVLEGLGHG